MRLTSLIASVLIILPSVASHASPYGSVPETGRMEFAIFRNGTQIGTHNFTFKRDGNRLTVSASVNIAVKFAFITVYRRTERKRETWRDGKLVAYEHDGDDDGDVERVRAYANGMKLVVKEPAGRPAAALGILPSTYWNAATVKQSKLLDSTTGEILPIRVAPLGQDPTRASKYDRRIERFRISGNLARDLWYDAQGRWVGMRLEASDGSVIEYRRK